MSGAAVARTLVDRGYDVTVVEARNRTGGRTWTDRTRLSSRVDLGAGWVHESVGNPITGLLNRFNIASVVTNYNNNKLYLTSGAAATSAQETSLDQLYTNVMRQVRQLANQIDNDMSVGQAIDQVTRGMGLTADQQRGLQYAINVNLEHEYGGDVSALSLWWYDEGSQFSGSDLMVVGGYDAVATGLLAGVKVLLNQVVTLVQYDTTGVTVSMKNGNTMRADYVVVTVPLGVLKFGSVAFSPPLPASKTTAMSHLRMGVLNKVVLEFPTVFWDGSVQVINYVPAVKGQWSESYNLKYYVNKPILVMFVAAAFGTAIETQTDDQVIGSAMAALRTIYGSTAPLPTRAAITRWNSDPFSRGSYSYSTVGATEPQDRAAMAATVGGRVFFAGEATSGQYPATVHGAYLSGLDCAARVLAAL